MQIKIRKDRAIDYTYLYKIDIDIVKKIENVRLKVVQMLRWI